MPYRAVVYIQTGTPEEKQKAALVAYLVAERWEMVAYIPYGRPQDATTMVREGLADVVVAAFDSRAVRRLAVELDGIAQVIVIHPEPIVIEAPQRHPRTVGDVITRMFRRGRTVKEIADAVGEATTDVRALLRKHGEHPG